jgi:hypothetical protein
VKPLPDLSGRVSLRPVEAARAVGVSLNTLLSWRALGLPVVTIGRCLLVPVTELRGWLSAQVVPTGPEQGPDSAGNDHGPAGGAADIGAGRHE